MGLSDELREGVGPIWEQVVTHPFVIKLGDNTLSQDRFRVYFDQDYLFLKDWAILLSLATAKAPDSDVAQSPTYESHQLSGAVEAGRLGGGQAEEDGPVLDVGILLTQVEAKPALGPGVAS